MTIASRSLSSTRARQSGAVRSKPSSSAATRLDGSLRLATATSEMPGIARKPGTCRSRAMVPAPANPMRSTLSSFLAPDDNVAMPSLDELGLRPLINAAGAYTMYGGSRLAPGVAEAMTTAGDSFVDLETLQRRVGARIAALTGNEACYVATGAAAGVGDRGGRLRGRCGPGGRGWVPDPR